MGRRLANLAQALILVIAEFLLVKHPLLAVPLRIVSLLLCWRCTGLDPSTKTGPVHKEPRLLPGRVGGRRPTPHHRRDLRRPPSSPSPPRAASPDSPATFLRPRCWITTPCRQEIRPAALGRAATNTQCGDEQRHHDGGSRRHPRGTGAGDRFGLLTQTGGRWAGRRAAHP